MNQGFVSYFRDANEVSKNVFKKKINVIKYYFMALASLVSSIFIFLAPIFSLANIRVAREAKVNKNINVLKSFAASNTAKSYWNVLLVSVFKLILFLSGILLIAVFTAILVLFGIGVSGINTRATNIVCIIFAVPGAIALLIYLFLFPFYVAPMNFIIDKKPSMGISNILYNSVNSVKKTGKRTIFLINLVYYLLLLLFTLVFFLIPVVLFFINSGVYRHTAIFIAGVITLAIVLLPFLYFLPRILFARKLAIISLYNDSIELNEYDNENIEEYFKISIEKKDKEKKKKESKKKIKAKRKEELLISLFSDSKTDGSEIIEEEKPKSLEEIECEEAKEPYVEDNVKEELKASSESFEEALEDNPKEEKKLEEKHESFDNLNSAFIENETNNDDDNLTSEEKEILDSIPEDDELTSEEIEKILNEIPEEMKQEIETEIVDEEESDLESIPEKEEEALEETNTEQIEAEVVEDVKPNEPAEIEAEVVEDAKSNEPAEIEAEVVEDTKPNEQAEVETDVEVKSEEATEVEVDEKPEETVEENQEALESAEVETEEQVEENEAIEQVETELDEDDELESVLNSIPEKETDEIEDALNSIPEVEEITYVDEEGNPVDENGNPIVEEIAYVDEDGNPVDENGNAIVEEPVEKKKSTRGRKSTTGTKKETTKKSSTRKKKSVEE